MDTATAITLLLALLILCGTAVGLEELRAKRRLEPDQAPPAPEPDPLEEFLGHELVVHTRRPDDQSVRGTLLEVGTWLRLGKAAYLPASPGAPPAPADGFVLVLRGNVSSMQVLAAGASVLEEPAAAGMQTNA